MFRKPHVTLEPGFTITNVHECYSYSGKPERRIYGAQVIDHPKLGTARVNTSAIQKITRTKAGKTHIHTLHTIYVTDQIVEDK